MAKTTEPCPPEGTPEYWLWQADRNIDRTCETGDGTHMWQATMQIRKALRTHLRDSRPGPAGVVKLAPNEWYDFATGIDYYGDARELLICKGKNDANAIVGAAAGALIAHLDRLAGVTTQEATA